MRMAQPQKHAKAKATSKVEPRVAVSAMGKRLYEISQQIADSGIKPLTQAEVRRNLSLKRGV